MDWHISQPVETTWTFGALARKKPAMAALFAQVIESPHSWFPKIAEEKCLHSLALTWNIPKFRRRTAENGSTFDWVAGFTR